MLNQKAQSEERVRDLIKHEERSIDKDMAKKMRETLQQICTDFPSTELVARPSFIQPGVAPTSVRSTSCVTLRSEIQAAWLEWLSVLPVVAV